MIKWYAWEGVAWGFLRGWLDMFPLIAFVIEWLAWYVAVRGLAWFAAVRCLAWFAATRCCAPALRSSTDTIVVAAISVCLT
jgi:hypothetical protein